MSKISEYEARIASALERIGQSVATVEQQAAEQAGGIASEEMTAEMGRLHESLETERETNAQLEQRVQVIHQTQQKHMASLEGEVETLRNQLMVHDGEIQKMRRVNSVLRGNNMALRDANAAGVANPELINTALLAELEALKASRSADMAELSAIRNELRPLITAPQTTAPQAAPEEA